MLAIALQAFATGTGISAAVLLMLLVWGWAP